MPLVTMPDGTQVQMPENPDPALLARLQAFRSSTTPKEPSIADHALGMLRAVGDLNNPLSTVEGLGHLVSGAIAAPVSGLAGLGAAGARAFGANVDPAHVVDKVQQGITYQPRTDQGKRIAGTIDSIAGL